MAWWQVLVTVLGSIGTLVGVATPLLYVRQMKRLKKTEADRADLQYWIDKVKYLEEEQKKLWTLLSERGATIEQMYRSYDELQKKYNYKKIAINEAMNCPNAGANGGKCPVMGKKAEIDIMFANSK
jgi:uncharacterized membrane-anchored protein YhcB (DUF1043 family)